MPQTKISLLSALPHSDRDIELSLGDARKDYVRVALRGFGKSAADVWAHAQRSLGRPADELFDYCRRSNVSVTTNAGIADLTSSSRSSDVVIVLAHWKGPLLNFLPADILTPVAELMPCVKQCVQMEILSSDVLDSLYDSPSEAGARDELARRLNTSIDSWSDWALSQGGFPGSGSHFAIPDSYGQNLARKLVDEIFGEEHLLPGARLELADGLWRPSDLSGCFDDGWQGICDFVCCRSTYLVEELSRQHPGALIRCDSRGLKPRQVIPITRDVISSLLTCTATDQRLSETYMSISHQCNELHRHT